MSDAPTPARESESQASQQPNDIKSSFHTRLTAFFWAHDPRRVGNVEELLLQHQGQEEEFIQRVHTEHGVRDFSGELAVDDLYEHQRYSYLSFSWGATFPGHLLPTDRRRWSSVHGAPSAQTRAKVEPQLPVGWRWMSDWQVDKETTNCDGDGWIYAFDFTNLNFMVQRNGGRREPKATDYVRRRRWIRRRERIPEPEKGASASTSEADPAAEDAEDEIHIPDSLDVDDEDGEDDGDEEDDDDDADGREEDGDNGAGVFPPRVERGVKETKCQGSPCKVQQTREGPPESARSATVGSPPSLQSFSMNMEKAAIDAAWTMAVKNLETIYSEAMHHTALKKKRWTVKKEKIQQQIHLLEKTIASMQSFAQEEHLKRRHSSSNLRSQANGNGNGLSTANVKVPLSPDAKSSYVLNGTTASRVSSNDTSGINLSKKLKCAQSKLDALKRMFWHPREKNYTLRFSIDGIFYGLRDFLVESLKGNFSISISHQSNGAQGITPTCKIIMKGHTVCCGKHVKVIGEKGTIVPKSLWDMMYLDSDFELTAFLIYVDDVEKERNPWLADKPTGSWEFLFTPESTRVELTNFNRRTRGGLDLPEPVVRKLMSDVLSTLVRDLALIYFPQELAMAFDAPPAKLDMEGELSIAGPSIDHVMEREIELTPGVFVPRPQPSPAAAVPSTPSPPHGLSVSSSSINPLSPTFAAVAAAASATVNLLIGGDTNECMRQIAELLELTPAQLNLLVAVRQCGLYPASFSFRSVSSICDYYNAFFSNKDHEDGGADHVKQLRATWKQLLELVYIRKMKVPIGIKAAQKFELFDIDKFFDRVGALTRKPVEVEISMKRFNCTVNAMSVVDAMAQMFERVVLGIDYSKPRVENNRLIYGFRFGRKPKVSAAAAVAAHAQSAQLLNPAIHLQMDTSFRSRLKAFSKFCRALKGGIEVVKQNLDRLSLEVVGNVHGTGEDCAIHGSFRDLDFSGPVSFSLHVPAMFLGVYQVQTIQLGNDRIGLQIELLLPLPHTNAKSKRIAKNKKKSANRNEDRVLVKAMLTDFSMDVLLDVDALIAKHHSRSMSTAMEIAAPWSPSAALAKQVETQKTNEQHPALSISVNSTTGANSFEADNVIRIPSPTSNPNEPYGTIRVTSSEFTKLQVRAKTGSFAANIMPLLKLLIRSARPFFLESFPEHQVLFDRLYSCAMKWLCAKELQVDFDFLVKSFLYHKSSDPSNELLFFTVCGSPTHPTPVMYRDEMNLLDAILQGDDLINIWIDDRYPPYSNPLYF